MKLFDLLTLSSVDVIDGKGNLREHDVSRVPSVEAFTRCGLRIVAFQKPAGNARCKRCELLRAADARRAARAKEHAS